MNKSQALEKLATNVIIPNMMREDYFAGTDNAKKLVGLSRLEYKNKLNKFKMKIYKNKI